ncbi:nuclear transport factor 2 family protein, partial [Microcoleus sp. C2C3]|uniref:nuclear transport factor 2 family protein n=1 Tax=unclassified Microcoleus TaxID=2642155 RepID=UPI002FCEC1A4
MIVTEDRARELALDWVEAWNTHNLDRIMSHYAEDVILISPVAAQLLNEPSGTVTGKEALRNYFKKGLEVYPDLKFELLDVMWGVSSVVLYYINQKGTKTGEFMEVSSTGKVTKIMGYKPRPSRTAFYLLNCAQTPL